MKKAQGIALNVIVIAAIALLVLVVLSVIFIGRIGTFGEGSKNCEGQGGICVTDQCPTGNTPFRAWTCPETASGGTQICCIQTGA